MDGSRPAYEGEARVPGSLCRRATEILDPARAYGLYEDRGILRDDWECYLAKGTAARSSSPFVGDPNSS